MNAGVTISSHMTQKTMPNTAKVISQACPLQEYFGIDKFLIKSFMCYY